MSIWRQATVQLSAKKRGCHYVSFSSLSWSPVIGFLVPGLHPSKTRHGLIHGASPSLQVTDEVLKQISGGEFLRPR